MQMAKMPTEEDGVRPLRGAKMGGNDFGSSSSELSVVFLFVTFASVSSKDG